MRTQKISFKGAKSPITRNTDAKHQVCDHALLSHPGRDVRSWSQRSSLLSLGVVPESSHTTKNSETAVWWNLSATPPLKAVICIPAYAKAFSNTPQLCRDEIGLHKENLKRWSVDSATTHIPLGGFKTTLGRKVSLPQRLSPSRALQPFTIASHLQGSLRLACIWNLPSGKVLRVFNLMSKLVT